MKKVKKYVVICQISVTFVLPEDKIKNIISQELCMRTACSQKVERKDDNNNHIIYKDLNDIKACFKRREDLRQGPGAGRGPGLMEWLLIPLCPNDQSCEHVFVRLLWFSSVTAARFTLCFCFTGRPQSSRRQKKHENPRERKNTGQRAETQTHTYSVF